MSPRPSMEEVEGVLSRHLLQNQHRALVVMNGTPHHLNGKNRRITLTAGTIGAISIDYTGFEFKISSASGDVYINNALARTGNNVPGCCVITFGGRTQRRQFVTFDVSNPEVMP